MNSYSSTTLSFALPFYGGVATIIRTLPMEIFIAILEQVDFWDTLRFRRTCKTFHEITKAKAIWIHLFRECKRLSPGALVLEKPLHMYSSNELERVVVVWKSTEVGWRSSDTNPSRHRTIPITCTSPSCGSIHCSTKHSYSGVYLVPGGRWLITFHPEGGMSYYDLESPDYEKQRPLVPNYLEIGPDCDLNGITFTVDIPDRCRTIQNFKLAQYVHENPNSTRIGQYRPIKIWNVSVIFDGQEVCGLQADCLKTILVDIFMCSDIRVRLSLRDDLLAFGLRCKPSGPTTRGRRRIEYIFVVEWANVEDGSSDYPRRTIYTKQQPQRDYFRQWDSEIRLLSNSKLARLSYGLWLYDFSSLPYTNYIPAAEPDYPDAAPVLVYPFYCRDSFAPVPTLSQDSVWLLALKDTTLSRTTVRVPNDWGSPGEPEISTNDLLIASAPAHDYSSDPFFCCFGTRRGVVQHRRRDYGNVITLSLFEYDRDQPYAPDYVPAMKMFLPSKPCNLLEEYEGYFRREPPLMDEGSGRVVVLRALRLEVVDFALVHKSTRRDDCP
ncbi:hypothetical protein D9613_007290 [Agrocybe pediades]|uniref:F-box domain-containing protein n=1 Tax=Agrocybe pediades TaxID=84607 RepID=A0A8H4VHP3_9AGAR|nr:hypothetical protein D9613_007290 [Agrocybe pediades]